MSICESGGAGVALESEDMIVMLCEGAYGWVEMRLFNGSDGVGLEMCGMNLGKLAGAQRLREDASINTITSHLFRTVSLTLNEPSTYLERLRQLHVTSEEKNGIVDRYDQSMYTVSHAPSLVYIECYINSRETG